MMASVYILYSASGDVYYVGCTKDFRQRFSYHILKEFPSGFTAKYVDWILYFEIADLTITSAIKIERHLKRMKSREYLENLKRYPEISKKLAQKYK